MSVWCRVWPLSLLAYVATARSLSLPRSRQDYKPCSSADVHGKKKPHPEKHVSSGEVGQGVCPEQGLKQGSDVTPSPHLLTRCVKPKNHVSSGEVGQGVCPAQGLKQGSDVTSSPHLLTRHVKPKKRHELHYLKEVRIVVAVKEECSMC